MLTIEVKQSNSLIVSVRCAERSKVAEAVEIVLDGWDLEEGGWTVVFEEIQADHIHLFLGISPAEATADAVKILTGIYLLVLCAQETTVWAAALRRGHSG